jgi:phosphoenolpyruvate carboxylase
MAGFHLWEKEFRRKEKLVRQEAKAGIRAGLELTVKGLAAGLKNTG